MLVLLQVDSLQQQLDQAKADAQSAWTAQQQTADQLEEAGNDKRLLQQQLDQISSETSTGD